MWLMPTILDNVTLDLSSLLGFQCLNFFFNVIFQCLNSYHFQLVEHFIALFVFSKTFSLSVSLNLVLIFIDSWGLTSCFTSQKNHSSERNQAIFLGQKYGSCGFSFPDGIFFFLMYIDM